jgi:glucose-6-phosphate 1-dehydrogenase
MFEPTWNRRHIDSVQITVAETLGVEHRADYYEKAGALRDMVGNHLFQILSLVAMEPPASFHGDDVRDEEVKVLKSIKRLTREDVIRKTVRGQYGNGQIEGASVKEYRLEPGVGKLSDTETYFAMKLEIDNWRWAGVPFYLRTGKRLASRVTEIAIQLKSAPFELFREVQNLTLLPNFLVMHIQPDEGITLNFTAKVPGPKIQLGDVKMTFEYEDYFRKRSSTGYETLLYDCMQVEQSWQAIMPILKAWEEIKPDQFPNYASGSAGPDSANELLMKDGRQWRKIEEEKPTHLKLKESA